MSERKKIPDSVIADVLTTSKRRCCICVALQNDLTEKKGQIAHLDHNPTNNDFDNLVFLCLEHHDQYDSSTSQSKGYTLEEVKRYKTILSKALLTRSYPISPKVNVRASAAFAGVRPGIAVAVLAISVENHSPNSIFIRQIVLELVDRKHLIFPYDYLTKDLNARRELRAGERYDFNISLLGLFSDGHTPEQFLGILAIDDINRIFRFEGEEFRNIMKGLYAEHIRI